MCGICGWINWRGEASDATVAAMADRLQHRGPDRGGLWSDPRGIAVLGHRRLKVIDLSSAADQPMVDRAGRVLVYNGEVYSYAAVRRDLEGDGIRLRSHGDTEVVAEALSHWGSAALGKFNGMFALAQWNPEIRKLLVARDRLGIKPLFYAHVPGGFVFASELSALLEHPQILRRLDREAVVRWLQLGYLPEASMIEGVQQLAPGHLLEVEEQGCREQCWYDLIERSQGATETGSAHELREQLQALLREAVSCRLVSDVELGSFLSAGVDSTAVVAAVHAEGRALETLTVRFEDGADEAGYAARTAARFGCGHQTVECSSADMLGVIDRWVDIAGDPLADPSLAPTYMVSQAARQKWTVALSGDGGDELLSGYPRLRFMPRLSRLLETPRVFRSTLGRVTPPRRWGAKLTAALSADGDWAAYQALQGVWPMAELQRLVPRRDIRLPWAEGMLSRLEGESAWRRYRLLDLLTFLPARVLAKVDRASMATSLEVRVPLLDHRIVEFLLRVPPRRARKALLGSVAADLGALPIPRRKRGFEVPLATWLRASLGEQLRHDLVSQDIDALGLDGSVLMQTWHEHQVGKRDHSERLWAIFVLIRWFRAFFS